MAVTALGNPYTNEGVELLRIPLYTPVTLNVHVVNSQRSNPRKLAWSTIKMPIRDGQSFDLAVAAVTIQSVGVTPPC